jgi:phosphatidylserine decarboxylase
MKISIRKIVISIVVIIVGVAVWPSPEVQPIRYIDRQTGDIKTEKVAGDGWLVWLYNNPVGEVTLYTLVKRKFVSSIYGDMMDKPKSAKKIEPFVKDYNIDLSTAQKQQFTSFNDFFIRKLKHNSRIIDTSAIVVVSPADGKALAYADISNQDFIVKGYRFNMKSFLNDPVLAEKYENGSLVIIRVCPTDYHRFHFPASGIITKDVKIDGDYYSVNPIAIREIVELFCLNKREYVTISTSEFGDIIMTEVGATMVGSIIQTYKGDIAIKGEEKGYFKFGGSSIVLLFEKGKVTIDKDLLTNTQKGLETQVMVGERIAIKKNE